MLMISCSVIMAFIWVFSGFLFIWGLGWGVLSSGSSVVLDMDFSSGFSVLINGLLVLDKTSILFSCAVLFISAWIMVYCGFYMSHEKFINRFLGLMILFVMSMNLLVLFPNLLFMMVGWDGLGVTSFLLVIYYMNYSSLSAGMITAITNRLGDAVFILTVAMAGCLFGYDYYFMGASKALLLMVFLLVVGSMTKSAQVPFSAWLPAAMAAPTPVSSLVHSSTLVTAGVYVMIRFNNILSSFSFFILLLVSVSTVIMAGLSALGEMDMKKVVALSTLSQVGVMMMALGLGLPDLALFHLLAHAFFKALMFMCVGSVIFLSGGVQDARFLSGLWFKSPIVFCWLVVCVLSLLGFPFMSGFYSKDLIMEQWVMGSLSFVCFVMMLGSIFLTSFYGVRMVVFLSRSEEVMSYRLYGEKNWFLMSSLFGMGFGALWGGYYLQGVVLSFNDFVFVGSLEKLLILSSVFLGFSVFLILTLLYYNFLGSSNRILGYLKSFFVSMWFLPPLSGNFCSSWFLVFCSRVVSELEKGWVSLLINSFFLGLGEGSKVARISQQNLIGILLSFGVFFVVFIFWL